MQLQFTREEMQMLAEILGEQAATRTDSLKARCYGLLDHVIAHDLGFASDELEDLQEILIAEQKALRARIAQVTTEMKPALSQREQVLRRAIDKVVEACAMV